MVTIEDMYKHFEVLSAAKEKASEHRAEYEAILCGVKGGSNEKRLASQFIARFSKQFLDLSEQSIDAMFDLCEDDDVNIRKQAIRDLPSLCKSTPEYVTRVADILTQLLQTEDNIELSLVHMSLVAILKISITSTLSGLFAQVMQGEEVIRERAITFLSNKLKTLSPDLLTKDVEDYIIQESKKILQDVTGTEFLAFMQLLSGLQSMQTMKGRQMLLDIVTEQAELEETFKPTDAGCVDRLIQCVKQAIPLFSKNVHSDAFLHYICSQVLPCLSELQHDEDVQLLKQLADMSSYNAGPHMAHLQDNVTSIYNSLIEYMPLPPADASEESPAQEEEPKFQFSCVECLMFSFHQLARHWSAFLTDDAERLKDFRLRLQYFARGVQLYIKQLRMSLQDKTGDALQTDENKIKLVALKITNNINILIKDLFHNPPSYKATVSLSFKPSRAGEESRSAVTAGQKRSAITPISFDGQSDSKKSVERTERKMYSPPEGKFSTQAGAFNTDTGRGRGGFRGNRGRGGYRGRSYTNRW